MENNWFDDEMPSSEVIAKWSHDECVFWLALHSEECEFLWGSNDSYPIAILRDMVLIVVRS